MFRQLDPNYEQKVRESFGRQQVMQFLGANLAVVRPGYVEIHLPFRQELTQQHGFLHAGVIAAISDSAGGYAAFSVMPPDASVLTVEFKVNFIAPAEGELLVARAQVVKAGRTLTLCKVDVGIVREGDERLCAIMQMTLMSMHGMMDRARE